MGVFGVDVSNHQSSFDFRGWDFAFIKASQGNWFADARFNQHLANARAQKALVAAYHYQETSSAESQVALIKEMVPVDIPVIIDVERGSGGVDTTRKLVALLEDAGYNVPFLYLPRWYWLEIGQPSLQGLPRLWASWYPDYVARPREEGIAKVPSSAWSGYGGNSVALMQFTSSPFDQNYFPGTRDELARLLNGGAGGGGTEDVLEYDRDKAAFIHLMDDYFRYHSRLGGNEPDSKNGPTVLESLDILVSRSVADVDEVALAEELAKRGLGGVSAAEVKAAMTEVLNNTKLAVGS